MGTALRALTVVATTALLFAGACKRSSSGSDQSLPAADNWSAPSPIGSGAAEADPHGGHGGHGGMGSGDPHAGMDMGDPHAGVDMSGGHGGMDMNNPHGGMDMNNPHGGMDMGDPQMAAIQPPDPDRPIDESKFLQGQISAAPSAADKVKPGAIMFLSVRPVDPTTGEIIGGPIAVDRVDITELPVSFRLTERHAMAAGTTFRGDVLVQARVDGDGEARTKEPGDVTGEVRAKIPSAKLALVLDTVLR